LLSRSTASKSPFLAHVDLVRDELPLIDSELGLGPLVIFGRSCEQQVPKI